MTTAPPSAFPTVRVEPVGMAPVSTGAQPGMAAMSALPGAHGVPGSPMVDGTSRAGTSSMLAELLANNKRYAASFNTPMSLGVKKKVAIVTCMDSRLLLDQMLGLGIGDAEIIRNAGGRVTPDVVRSLFVAQEVPELSCRAVLIIHHTDCGAQAVMRHHDALVGRMQQLVRQYNVVLGMVQDVVAWGASWVPAVLRKKALNFVMRPFKDEAGSVREDAWLLRRAPLMPADIPIFGLVYDVQDGTLKHVVTA